MRGYPDERPTPLERPLDNVNLNMWNISLEHTPNLMSWGSDPIRKSFPDLSNTPAKAQLYDTGMVLSVRSSEESVPYPPGLEPYAYGVRIHSCFLTI